MTIIPLRPDFQLKQMPTEGVRVIGVALRCLSCRFEWRADLMPSGEVVSATARCPRCTHQMGPNNAA